MKRKHKNYSRPKKPFEKKRIEEEGVIKKQFGLKNKREIWKAEAKVKIFREKAKKMITASKEEQQALFARLKRIGFNVNSIADVLSLKKEDYLKRRLQTVVFEKKLAKTVKEARQLIVHKKVLIDGKVINVPAYPVPVELENKISLKKKETKKKAEKTENEEKTE